MNKWGCWEAFQDNANCAKQLRNITSHVGNHMNVSWENMIGPKKSKNAAKTAKIEG